MTATPTSRPTDPPPAGLAWRELRPEVVPATYLDDACSYLAARWDPGKSPPGSVVQPIMFHSIREPGNMPQDQVTVSTDYLQAIVDTAVRLGFETITTEQLIAFLTRNDPIPARSMIWIMDDRYPGALAQYLLPQLEAHSWTVTLGWIIGDTGPDLWRRMEDLARGGRLDVQSHGLSHRYLVEEMSDDELRTEIAGPIPILEDHFGKRPLGFVWPGGNFTRRSVETAREAGFEVGFTAYSRGPLLFNWIPLGPLELAVEDPLMVLPRAWSPSAVVNLEQAARLGDDAAQAAQDAWPTEAEWYRVHCGGSLPPP